MCREAVVCTASPLLSCRGWRHNSRVSLYCCRTGEGIFSDTLSGAESVEYRTTPLVEAIRRKMTGLILQESVAPTWEGYQARLHRCCLRWNACQCLRPCDAMAGCVEVPVFRVHLLAVRAMCCVLLQWRCDSCKFNQVRSLTRCGRFTALAFTLSDTITHSICSCARGCQNPGEQALCLVCSGRRPMLEPDLVKLSHVLVEDCLETILDCARATLGRGFTEVSSSHPIVKGERSQVRQSYARSSSDRVNFT